ncbi:MAG TPA: response regulator transcription factor [Chloroflexi bacterium]|nr:response regulator transcription factor [Chloroflexota bacterium]
MTPAKILVVDDEANIVRLVQAYLQQEGYEVYTATDGLAALKAARTYRPDLVVLDIMLPGMDGLEVLAQLRRESDVYVILLTAKTEETDRIVGLTLGADDYVPKPFSPRELVARVKAALRRIQREAGPLPGSVLVLRRLRLDQGRREVTLDGKPVHLTPTEFDLLMALARYPGMVLSREQLITHVWGANFYGEQRVVDVHIGHIRQKLEAAGGEGLIVTVRGVGYRLEDELT